VRAAAAALALFAAPLAGAAVEVKSDSDGRLSVRAEAPASDVLERLGAHTGMKVVFEGGAPRARVQIAFEGRTPAEAVLMVLEGLGYDFLVRYDRSGARPELLIVTGPSNVSSPPLSPTAAAPAVPMRRPLPVQPVEEEPPMIEEEIIEGEEPAAEEPGAAIPGTPQQPQAPTVRPAFGAPTPTYPASPFAPASPGLPTVIVPPSPPPSGEAQAQDPDQ
jgi:hypothetical protein